MKIILLNLFLFISSILLSQNLVNNNLIIKHYTTENWGDIYETIDTLNGDTIRQISKSKRYIKKSKEGVLLIDGHKMSRPCGCIVVPHGYWIERYRNGELKEQGKYHCNQKIGTWIFYYKNGQIAKVESFKAPYSKVLTKEWKTLKRYLLREGAYLEYYQNGQLKVEGIYKIIEEYSKTDTIFTLDMETFEKIPQIVEGTFWIPRSKKSGIWNYYAENGAIVSHRVYKINQWKEDKIRPIESRYWELFGEIFKKE